MSTLVVYVHGLWQRGAESVWLRRRLARDLEAETRVFSYPSVRGGLAESALALEKFLRDTRADTVHLVGHSLGGVVILKLFEHRPALPPGRIVLLGSPLGGSRTGRNLARLPLGSKILGRIIREEVLVERRRFWDGSRDLGIIAGDSGFGLGRLVGRLDGPSDGTILTEETRLDGATDHVVLPVGHTWMVFSAAVARQVGAFLGTGRFQRR